MEGAELPPELSALVYAHMRRTKTDEISLRALEHRWSKWFSKLPELEEMSPAQVERGRQILRMGEERRQLSNVLAQARISSDIYGFRTMLGDRCLDCRERLN
jgi:hypothetical protein